MNRTYKKNSFSFLIPNLGYSSFLFDCLDSVVNQKTDDSFECYIYLCDQSDNETHKKITDEINKKYQDKKRIFILHSKEKSVTLARHKMLSLCKSDYFCFVDSDDYVDRDFLLTINKLLYANNYPDIIITNYLRCDENGKDLKNSQEDYKDIEKNYLDYFLYTNALNSLCTKVINRKLYNHNDYSDFSNYNGEDFVMNYPMMMKASSILCRLDICKYHYRQRKGSRITNITFDGVIHTLKTKNTTPLAAPNTAFQKSLKLKMIISYFSDTMQKMIRSKRITKEEYFIYINYIDNIINKEQLFIKTKLSSKEKIVYKLLVKKRAKLLFVVLWFASKR